MIRNFGRNASDVPSGPASPALPERTRGPETPPRAERGSSSNSVPKIDPPIQRFLDTQHATELTIGDVSALLDDYKRLAALLEQSTASST